MTSPVRKRPAVTYQRRSTNKITEEFQSSALLNPDAALQEKINSVLFGKNDETTGKVFIGKEDDDFDSAYHETMVRSSLNICMFYDLILLYCRVMLKKFMI